MHLCLCTCEEVFMSFMCGVRGKMTDVTGANEVESLAHSQSDDIYKSDTWKTVI